MGKTIFRGAIILLSVPLLLTLANFLYFMSLPADKKVEAVVKEGVSSFQKTVKPPKFY